MGAVSSDNSDAISTTTQQQHCLLHDRTIEALRNKNVLLTGASGGLGQALALQVATSGGCANLILSGRNREALQKVADACQQAAGAGDISKTHILTCDLSNPDQVDQLAADAIQIVSDNDDAGCIDVLINNGGVSSRSRFVDTRLEVDRLAMQINFFAGAALAKAVVPGMEKKKSKKQDEDGSSSGSSNCHIVWISSVQGLVGIPNRSSYAASKFAVQGYCESIRAELASAGVSVHTVSPGYIRTNLSRSALTGDGGQHGQLDATTAAGADPTEVAIQILDECLGRDKPDLIVAATPSAIAAVWLRLLCPGLLRTMLRKRYEKSQQQEHEGVNKEKEE